MPLIENKDRAFQQANIVRELAQIIALEEIRSGNKFLTDMSEEYRNTVDSLVARLSQSGKFDPKSEHYELADKTLDKLLENVLSLLVLAGKDTF